jgi:hypothetical protein
VKGCLHILGDGLAYYTDDAGSKYPLRCSRVPVDERGFCELHKTPAPEGEMRDPD